MNERGRVPGVLRLGLALLAVVVVAGVVVAAAGSGAGGDPPIRAPRLGTAVAVVLVALVASGLVVAFSILRTLERGDLRKRVDTTIRDIVLLVLIVALIIAIFQLLPAETDTSGDPTPPPPAAEDEPALPVESGRDWLTVAVVAALTAIIGLTLLRRRRPIDEIDDATQAALARDVAEVLDDAIERLRRETDARRAVIAAYAAMEDVFARHRLPRRPSEAPLEFLARALEHVSSTGPASRLTDLFERAMFSTEPFDRRRQDEAIDALVAVRDDVRSSPARSRS
jgi:hypothetical protein